jgi:U3 small nucleolar RNA-associated protein 23
VSRSRSLGGIVQYYITMRHGRSKAARKTLQFFARTQGFKAPFHILLDGTFLVAVVKYKYPLRERLDKLLQHASFTLYTTASCLNELTKLKQANKEKAELLDETLQWASKECTRIEQVPDFDKPTMDRMNKSYPDLDKSLSQPGLDILRLALHQQQLAAKHKYFVACQDDTVLDVLRQSGAVPCIRLARGSVLLLENPSKSGQMQDSHAEKKKWTGGTIRDEERTLVSIAREDKKRQLQQHPVHQQQPQHARKKRKATEPNPLSCKKSKASSEETGDASKKRRRRRNKTGTATGTTEEE